MRTRQEKMLGRRDSKTTLIYADYAPREREIAWFRVGLRLSRAGRGEGERRTLATPNGHGASRRAISRPWKSRAASRGRVSP